VCLPADDDDMSETWSITITFTPTGCFSLHADAELTAGLEHLSGRGDTRKHPSDPHISEVAAEIAAARALNDLAEQLQQLAAERMQPWDRTDVFWLPPSHAVPVRAASELVSSRTPARSCAGTPHR